MSSSLEKSVKGATKIKLAPPKSKYIEHILIATHTGEHGVAEVFRSLQNRLRDSTWTIVFKGLIVVHFMLREGQEDVTLRYLATSPRRKLAINNFTEGASTPKLVDRRNKWMSRTSPVVSDVQTQGRNIRDYADYLTQRAESYSATKTDYVRKGEGRLKNLSVDKGLLRETESVQDQIKALIKCDFFHSHEPENEITLTAFRLLTMDLLALFHVMNEGTISVLEHFFELSKPDAERALKIYKAFVKQTDQVVRYLSVARHFEHATRLEIPKLKHAPTSLSKSLEEYVKDTDFEINRRQYLAQQDAKKGGSKATSSTPIISKPSANGSASTTTAAQAVPKPATKGPAPDLIDFFSSIEQNQQPMIQAQYQQPQFAPQMSANQTNPFLPQSTGMAPQQQFGGNPMQTNPFLQMPQQQQLQQLQPPQLPPNFTGAPYQNFAPQQQNMRFTPTLQSVPQSSASSFQPSPQQPFATGTTSVSSAPSTNPFRQSMIASTTGTSSISSFSSGNNSPFTNQPTSGNPFGRPTSMAAPVQQGFQPSPYGQQPTSAPFSPVAQSPVLGQGPLGPQPTGINPFAKPQQASPQTPSSPFGTAPVSSNPTGSTNPFRQSQFVNQNTGIGWQNSQQGTIGGFSSNQVDTVPVFPRPGMSQ